MNVGDVYFEKNTVTKVDANGKEVEMEIERVNAIEIPDNATNGDMIKAMFPKAPIKYEEFLIKIHFYEPAKIDITFHKCWWDAPYKENKK